MTNNETKNKKKIGITIMVIATILFILWLLTRGLGSTATAVSQPSETTPAVEEVTEAPTEEPTEAPTKVQKKETKKKKVQKEVETVVKYIYVQEKTTEKPTEAPTKKAAKKSAAKNKKTSEDKVSTQSVDSPSDFEFIYESEGETLFPME